MLISFLCIKFWGIELFNCTQAPNGVATLGQALECRIEVHAVGMPLLVLGSDHSERVLRVCYMRHAFGLGEHYNSVQLMPDAAQHGADN